MILTEDGTLYGKQTDVLRWNGTTDRIDGRAIELLGGWHSYSGLYRKQLWVSAAVNKIAGATARLPLKVYRRGADTREDARDTPYGLLMQRPSKKVDPFTFWVWVRSTLDIYGESFLGKVRDRGGRPIELIRLHPVFMHYDDNTSVWSYDDGKKKIENIPRRDLIHFRFYNPDSERGMSPLEPLRSTLELEDGMRRGFAAPFKNGARPGVVLSHPKVLGKDTGERLKAQWADVHSTVDNWGKTVILEEGMTATVLTADFESLQYIEARKLSREEVCAGYDIPPPALHILDHATYSNITEQNRALYRDTMAPKLGHLESTLEMELRDGRMGKDVEPDFPDNIYAEFLLDEVLRGAFEARAIAYQQSDFMTIAEKRQKENLPFIPGTDRIFLNSASLPLGPDGQLEQPEPATPPALPPAPPEQLALPPAKVAKALAGDTLSTLMGRLSRIKTLDQIDTATLTAGLNGHTDLILDTLAGCDTVDEFKACLKGL